MTSCLSDSCNIRWKQRSDGSRVAELYHPDAPKRVTPTNVCTGFYEDQNGCTSVLPTPFGLPRISSGVSVNTIVRNVTEPFNETVGQRVSVTATNTTCYAQQPIVEHRWGNMEFSGPNGSAWSFTRLGSELDQPVTCHYTPESFAPNSGLTIPFTGASQLSHALAIRLAYRDLLNRDPDEAGMQYWLAEIANGNIANDVDLRTSILGNTEAITNAGDPQCYDLASWPSNDTDLLLQPGESRTFWTQLDWAAHTVVGESGTMTLRNGVGIIVWFQPVAPDGFGTCC